MNVFYIFDNVKHSRIELDSNFSIKKVKISQLNPSNNDATIFVAVQVGGKLDLRYYQIEDLLLKEPKANLIQSDISTFILEKTDLVVIKEEQSQVRLTNVRLSDLSREEFSLKNESKLVQSFVKNKFVILEFENQEKQIDLFALDLRNRRFLKIDYKERYETNKLSVMDKIEQS